MDNAESNELFDTLKVDCCTSICDSYVQKWLSSDGRPTNDKNYDQLDHTHKITAWIKLGDTVREYN